MLLPTTLPHRAQHEQTSKPPPVRLMSLWMHKHITVMFFGVNYRTELLAVSITQADISSKTWGQKFLRSKPELESQRGSACLQSTKLCTHIKSRQRRKSGKYFLSHIFSRKFPQSQTNLQESIRVTVFHHSLIISTQQNPRVNCNLLHTSALAWKPHITKHSQKVWGFGWMVR